MKEGVIYKVENLDNGKVYVGCTTDFSARVSHHLKAATRGSKDLSFYADLKNTPEKFGFQILEAGVPLSRLRIAESEWISKLKSSVDGYNRCVHSGNEKLTELQVTEIEAMLEAEKLAFKEIADLFDIDSSAVSDINRGKSWRKPLKEYPLRKSTVTRKKLSLDDLERIHELLADNSMSFSAIAAMFGWKSQAVLRKINAGTYSIRLRPQNVYPIRPVDSRKGSRQR